MTETHIYPEFYMATEPNPAKTAKEGRPIFDQVEMVKMRIAGDKGTELHAPAHTKAMYVREHAGDPGRRISYIERFPEEYRAFKANLSQAVTGTPVEEATFLNLANRAELKALNIFTIEALAGLEKTEKLGMHGERWRDQARAYLARAGGAAQDSGLIAEKEALQRELADMRAQIAALKDGGAVNAEAPAANAPEVLKPGPFFGYTAAMLREFIKERSGAGVKGNPKLESLLSMAEDLVTEAAE